jgi:hypothetical protein
MHQQLEAIHRPVDGNGPVALTRSLSSLRVYENHDFIQAAAPSGTSEPLRSFACHALRRLRGMDPFMIEVTQRGRLVDGENPPPAAFQPGGRFSAAIAFRVPSGEPVTS